MTADRLLASLAGLWAAGLVWFAFGMFDRYRRARADLYRQAMHAAAHSFEDA